MQRDNMIGAGAATQREDLGLEHLDCLLVLLQGAQIHLLERDLHACAGHRGRTANSCINLGEAALADDFANSVGMVERLHRRIDEAPEHLVTLSRCCSAHNFHDRPLDSQRAVTVRKSAAFWSLCPYCHVTASDPSLIS